MNQYLTPFKEIFSGLQRAYGQYQLKGEGVEGEKFTGQANTISKRITDEVWDRHLSGVTGLGIVPITDNATCIFGAIDIDVYKGLDIKKVIYRISREGFPLVPCRTKSGGLHLYCFVREEIPASLMQSKLQMMASYLGFGSCEIFPKQTSLMSDRGDVGSWINLPYFDEPNTERYAYSVDAKQLLIEDFFTVVNNKRWTLKEFEAFSIIGDISVEDGPPCLQNMVSQGFKIGIRNLSLFQLGLYLRKKDEDGWPITLKDYNANSVVPPIPEEELTLIINSIRKKGYRYGCSRSPLKNYCNRAICIQREFGIGGESGHVVLRDLKKYDTEPPIWFVEVVGMGRLELTTEDLQKQANFQRRCMESLNVIPVVMSKEQWQMTIQELMSEVEVLAVPKDASLKGLLFEHLEKFCTSNVQARDKEEILRGKAWTDEDYHWFRLSDFYSYLERIRFKEFKIQNIASILQEDGGKHQPVSIKGVSRQIWKFPRFNRLKEEKYKVPDIEDKNIL